MEFIRLTPKNLEKEHICCAISNNNDCQVASKKAWIRERLKEGLVFLKADVRGKCFIEYIPAEFAWAPVDAPNYMYIDCLWVSGQWKGQGLSTQLLDQCIQDSKEQGKKGIVILSSAKKRAFLADSKFLQHKGFLLADKRAPFFELWYLPFEEAAPMPEFRPQTELPGKEQKGFVLYYTKQCPFTAKYVPLVEHYAKEHQLLFESILIDSCQKAQNAPLPFTTYALFYDGVFVTHEILSEKKFETIVHQVMS